MTKYAANDLRNLAIKEDDKQLKCVYDDMIITVSKETGYFDACRLCDSFNNDDKTLARWMRTAEGEDCICALEKHTGLSRSKLITMERLENDTITWAHPKLLLYLVMWCNKERGFRLTDALTQSITNEVEIDALKSELKELSENINHHSNEIKELRRLCNF